MASPLQTGKQSVKLGAPVRGSRIRRDPPPIAKKVAERDPEERDQVVVIVGVIVFALAIFVIILAFGSYSGWSPSEYTIELRD
jgi:hypothetical protein